MESKDNRIKILVAAHKPYWVPSDPMYVPVQAGAVLHEHIPGFSYDDQGKNISELNPMYCELTVLWWGWQNLECDALGLVHYRRHLAGLGERGVLSEAEAADLLAQVPVVVPKERNYVIESVASHYAHALDPVHVESLRAAVGEVSPRWLDAFDWRMEQSRAHMFNMLLMKREVLDPYCDWLFDVLSAAQHRVDFCGMTAFEARCMGRLGEFLLDVWLNAKGVPYAEVGLCELEKVDWIKKGSSFLAAKFLGKRYDASF